MDPLYCWHQPGRRLKGEIYACKRCGVAIEECGCVEYHRMPERLCRPCEGSGWVAIVRGRRAVVSQALDFSGLTA